MEKRSLTTLPGGARLVDVTAATDQRGKLLALQEPDQLPFAPKRAFIISDVPSHAKRAQHAVSCNEFLIILSGACRISLKTLDAKTQIQLAAGRAGLYVPAGIWMETNEFEEGTILLVIASATYEDTVYWDRPRI